ncbi:hypothetical protein F511_40612 [Dorcoceras hygrometricum]|uniref:Syntaxin 6/10/61 N-terminal domain-containing protein n=1 Tax=Dorcoceras hygrometricum TaxID=472368 RepID=A0A2Z7DCK6_9LAMI|nr:hypothetical protein F511_40612 [Dorcoceras hygrometricum]
MLVANSFDLWQKDTFFSAAEEVQQSADVMESAYRTWLRAKREGSISQQLDELGRDLQRALDTAKWQLEEFEKAVCMSYRKHSDDITITRHRQFVSALEDQISHVEATLKESFNVEEKKSLQWVDIDQENCEDFALFLSGSPGTSLKKEDESEKVEEATTGSYIKKNCLEKYCSLGLEVPSKTQIPNNGKTLEVGTSSESSSCLMELEKRKLTDTEDEMLVQSDKLTCNLRSMKFPDKSSLEIVIDSDDRQKKSLTQATPKEKGSKPSFWRSRCEQDPEAKGLLTQSKIINWVNQVS